MRCGARYAGRQAGEAADDCGARSVQARARLQIVGAGHGEKRTSNMPHMFVTLEVSKLSGWLNTDASCRYSNGGMRCGARCIPAGRRGGTRSVYRAGLGYRWGAGHAGTLNMKLVDVKGGHTVCRARCGPGGGIWQATLQAACRGGPDWRLGAGHEEERT